jgi:hypothetical protein
MVVEPIASWLPREIERELEALCVDLRAFSGYRTVWLDRRGRVWHGEPDLELPDDATYLGTFFRPTRALMQRALAAALPLRAAS